VIVTDSSTMIAVSDRKRMKNPQTQTIRKLMDQQGGKITFVWLPGNENADTASKEALNERILSTKKYSPQDLTKWIERKYQELSNKKNVTTQKQK
jgi:hypothetical protein